LNLVAATPVVADDSTAQISEPARPRIAVVLSGGSAFGIAHAGVLKKIEEAGIPIDMILGTSMGSIVGGLYAAGYSPQAMQDLISSIDWNSLFMDPKELPQNMFERSVESMYALRIGFDSRGPNIGTGLLEGQNILSFFTARTIHMAAKPDFDAFPVPYRAVAANVLNGDKVVFDHGSLAEAMRSSMSIPVVFMPYEYNGQLLVDGGVVDNLPVDIAKKMGADIVIAVVSRGKAPDSIDELNTSVEIGSQTGNLFIMQNMKPNIEAADLVITPNLQDFTTASYARAKEIIARGEEAGEAAMPRLRELAAKIAARRALVTPSEQANRKAFAPPPVFSSLRVEGGTPSDRDTIASIFAPLVGRVYSREALESALHTAYVAGDFSLVTFDLEQIGDAGAPGALVGVVSLVPKKPVENELFASLDFQGAVSDNISSNMVVSSGFLAKELTGHGSALLASISFVNKTSASIEYFQPLGSFFLLPWGRFRFEYDMSASESIPVAVASKFRTYGAGVWGGLVLGNIADVMAGYSFENVLTGNDWASLTAQNAGALRAALRLDTRDRTAFPRRGIALTAYGHWFSPNFGGQFSFAQIEVNASTAIPLGRADALHLSVFGGTDFAGIVTGAQPAKISYYSTLNQPSMFYGIGYVPSSCAGNSVFAGSVEYQHRVKVINELTGGDIYLFANGSAGAVVQYDDPTTYAVWPPKWSATLGASARLSRHYGMLVGVSLFGNIDDTDAVMPAFVIQIGSFNHASVIDRR
jgi:NTE family protein